MTRLEKGGIRLRLITALTAVTVIAAGVYAAYGKANPKAKTAFVISMGLTPQPTVQSGNVVRLEIKGLSANTVYEIRPKSGSTPDLAGWLNTPTFGTGSGLNFSNPAGFSYSTSPNAFRFTTDPTNGRWGNEADEDGEAVIYLETKYLGELDNDVVDTYINLYDVQSPQNQLQSSNVTTILHH